MEYIEFGERLTIKNITQFSILLSWIDFYESELHSSMKDVISITMKK